MPTRQKTRDELLKDVKASQAYKDKGLSGKRAAEEDPYAFARTHSIPLERDATPQKKNAAQQAAENAAEDVKKASAGRSTRTATPGKQRPTSTENATPPHERKMTPAEAEAYALEEKEKREAAGRSTQSSASPRASSSSSLVQDRINELEENLKATTSPGRASGTSSRGSNAVSPQRARISSASGTSNQSPAPATQSTPSSRRASFAPEVNQSRHASRSRSGTPSQNQSYDAMHEFAERARASSAPRSRTPAERREEDAFIPNYDWENPFSYDNSVRTDEEIAEMERANAASQTARESIGGIEDEHKNIMKLAHKQYAKPHQVWKVNPVAELSPAQKEYRRNLKRDSPYSEEAQEERAATVDALTPYLTDRTQTEIMEPYVENMTQDPGRLYKELMEPTEKEHLQSVYDEANDNFTKKILPGIRARYHVPGLRQHGQMRSDLNNATQRFGKGVGSAVAEHKGAFRKMGFEVAQRHAGLQGQAADLMSKGAESQRHNNLQAFGALREFKKQDNAEKNLFNQQVNVMGTADRQRDQDRINEQKNRFTEAQEAPARKLGQLADIQNKYQFAQPIQMPQRTPSSAGQVEKELASVGMGAAGTLFNQAMNPQPQTNRGHFKTGGRVKKAFGGIVNPAETAIDNAVVQKTSPIYELRRLMNLPDPVQQYAIGGLVSPITAGAQEAQQYAGHAAMKNKLQRMRKGPPEIGVMGALADATGDSSGQGWLGQSLKAFHAGYSRQDQRRLAQQQRVDSADDLEYKLQSDIEAKAHKERDMARQEMLAKAQMDHYGAQNTHLGLQGDKIRHEIANPKPKPIKYTRADQESLLSAGKTMRNAPDLMQDLNRLEELSKKLNTGSLPTNMLGITDPYKLAKTAGGDQADWDEYIKLSRSLSTKAASVFSNRSGAAVVKLFQEENPNILMKPKAIAKITEKMKFQIKRAQDRAYAIHDAEQQGINPAYAEMDFDKKIADEEDSKQKKQKEEKTVSNNPTPNNKLELLNQALLAAG